eukprot:CAMPEP_0195070384 /NCGR_PEP_ID=MMETSP0448-20130528/14452_1 /TAXON_ID=66468 /ORGANISM="Heterocapsa triquestra, Strain CCMP 448" /LENGTH=183 /DNA_ID=CAMNT_0040102085 /DNA_START=354 /DNA_END=905 /DNA_ORIENTATION=+
MPLRPQAADRGDGDVRYGLRAVHLGAQVNDTAFCALESRRRLRRLGLGRTPAVRLAFLSMPRCQRLGPDLHLRDDRRPGFPHPVKLIDAVLGSPRAVQDCVRAGYALLAAPRLPGCVMSDEQALLSPVRGFLAGLAVVGLILVVALRDQVEIRLAGAGPTSHRAPTVAPHVPVAGIGLGQLQL